MATVLEAALAASAAGLSVIPIRSDGSKKTSLSKWKPYQLRRATEQEIRTWFSADPARGMAVVAGAISGGVECFEFEGRAVAAGIRDEFRRCADQLGLGGLLTRIEGGWLDESPSGGVHLHWRCCDASEENRALALRPATEEELAADPTVTKQLLIEVRGEGQYFITAPTNGRVHETGRPWKRICGGIATVAIITGEERRAILDLARSFNQMPAMVDNPVPARAAAHSGKLRPGDDFNTRGNWADILVGWTYLFTASDGRQYWRRPGKQIGTSATITADGNVLTVFSTSVVPLVATIPGTPKGYSKFGAYTVLEHDGDYKAAAKALAAQGYGERAGEIRHSGASSASFLSQGVGVENKNLSACVRLVSASDVEPEEVTWAYTNRIPVGMVSLLVGRGGQGKSLLLCHLAAGWSRGTVPGAFFGKPISVAIASSEDHRSAVIVPRLLAAGADLGRIHFVEHVDSDGAVGDMNVDGRIELIEAALVSSDVKALLIDTVVSHIPSEHDSFKEQHVRRVLTPLAKMGERLSIWVVGTMHLNRREGVDVLSRIMGSGGFGNLARSVLVFGRDPKESPDSDIRLLAHGKCNVGPEQPTVKVRVQGCDATAGGRLYPTARVQLLEEVSSVFADDLLSAKTADHDERSTRRDAEEFLASILRDGSVKAQDVQDRAQAAGHSWATVRRAQHDLGIKPLQLGRVWLWSMPSPAAPSDAQPLSVDGAAEYKKGSDAQVSLLSEREHLTPAGVLSNGRPDEALGSLEI